MVKSHMVNARLAPAPAPSGGYQTKQAMVLHTLREAIRDGRLEPGRRLVIDDLAAGLGVSAIPVREALSQLQSERLVEIRPHAGAVVAPVSREAVRELFALMEALELLAARSAVTRIDDAGVAALRAIVAAMDAATAAGDHRAWSDGNARFHRAIVDAADLPLVRDFTDRVLADWERLRRHAFGDAAPPDPERAQREHKRIVAALAKRDAAALEQVIAAHNRGAAKSYL